MVERVESLLLRRYWSVVVEIVLVWVLLDSLSRLLLNVLQNMPLPLR